jgi:hypothetical protein
MFANAILVIIHMTDDHLAWQLLIPIISRLSCLEDGRIAKSRERMAVALMSVDKGHWHSNKLRERALIIMTLKLTMSVVILSFAIVRCGGGGGEYYPPKVVINSIGVTKEEISITQIDIESKIILEVDLERKPENEKHIAGVKYYYFSHFDFKGHKYLLAIPLDDFVSIIDSEKKVVKKLPTPRYATNAAAIELSTKNDAFLAIYIAQQATSHSSTFYILNEEFEIVYEEHLLGALWMAKESSKNGDNLVISAEPKWIPKDRWISVGGPWRYILFGKGVIDR